MLVREDNGGKTAHGDSGDGADSGAGGQGVLGFRDEVLGEEVFVAIIGFANRVKEVGVAAIGHDEDVVAGGERGDGRLVGPVAVAAAGAVEEIEDVDGAGGVGGGSEDALGGVAGQSAGVEGDIAAARGAWGNFRISVFGSAASKAERCERER